MILAVAMVMSMFAGIAITASAAEGNFELANAIAVGDTVILANVDGTKVFTGVANSIGVAADATPVGNILNSAEAATLTVEAGTAEGSVAFKMEDGTYIGFTGTSNKLYALEAIEDASSWMVVITEGAAVVTNVANEARVLQYNKSNPRFCAYTGSQGDVNFFKPSEGCTHENATGTVVTPATCVDAGEMTFTCTCGATWTAAIPALGHSYNEGTVTTDPKCTEEGVLTKNCTVCNAEITEVVPALGHNYVDGFCTVCNAEQAPVAHFKAVSLAEVMEGNYVIGAIRADVYPTVYLATGTVKGGDWVVSDTAITANEEDTVSSENFPVDGQIFVFKGNNTDGFTIGFELDGVMQYLGYTDTTANRKLAFAPEYETILWTVIETGKGGFALSSPYEGGNVTVSQNSTSNTAIRGYKSGAIYTGLYLFSEFVYCAHENTTEIAAVDADCTTAGNTAGVVCNDCGRTLSGNETIPALGHNTSISVVDGNVVMVCANCDLEESVALNTIAEAKAYTDKTVVYNVKGIVTYVNGRNVYIEDENDAICAYFAADFDTSAIELGDEIFVSATMTEYKGLLELNAPAEYHVLSKGNELPNKEVTLAELLADTENAFLGERVTVTGLKVGIVNTGASTNLTDAEGNTIALFKAANMAENVTEGDTITVTAIVSAYNAYQLIVNPGTILTDIVVTDEGSNDTPIETVDIATAKAGEAGTYYQVEGVVTAMSADKRTIYIQDATAGIALYLTARPAEAVCALGDKVKAYGAYKLYNGLIELDAIDASNPDFFEILSSGNTVEAQLVDIVTLAVDLDNEYLAEKVRIEGATITAIDDKNTITLDQNGTIITIYKAPALTEEFVVGAIINVTAVVSSYNGYQLLVNEASDIEFVSAPQPEEPEQPEQPKEPILVEGIKIGHTLNLASDISINFAVQTSVLNAYETYYLECKLPIYENGEITGYNTINVEPVLNGNYYYFTLLGVTAVMMNDMVEATLHMTIGDQPYVSTVDTYSVGTYAYSQLNKANASAALKALCADLLRYGACAQIYKNYRTDALVNGAMTEDMIALLSDIDAVTFNNVKDEIVQLENPTVTLRGRSLSLDSKVTLNYILNLTNYQGKLEDLTIRVTYKDINGVEKVVVLDDCIVYDEAQNFYSFSFDSLLAAELRTVLTAVVYEGETQVSNAFTYTIDTYGNGKKGTLLDLCKALMAYSDTALAYFAG